VPPAGWEFLPSASGEQSWVVDSQTKLSGAHSVRALLSELSLRSVYRHTHCTESSYYVCAPALCRVQLYASVVLQRAAPLHADRRRAEQDIHAERLCDGRIARW